MLDKERVRMLEAFAIVSSLAFTTVADFLLAYLGGNWLDNYFQTGDHTLRSICIGIAVLALFMTYYELITKCILTRDKKDKNEE
ncbi:MAG: hypothetical protein LUF25_06630 [Phascolarctobacterium sp.]|nr:hypothetical protein [Phascolarctobacterium sp.]